MLSFLLLLLDTLKYRKKFRKTLKQIMGLILMEHVVCKMFDSCLSSLQIEESLIWIRLGVKINSLTSRNLDSEDQQWAVATSPIQKTFEKGCITY